MTLNDYLEQAWIRYSQIAPDAAPIHKLLSERGEKVLNDHIAFRTFNLPGMSRLELGALFEAWGYKKVDDTLEFPEKHLLANYYLPPESHYPKVFVSELILEDCSKSLRDWITSIVKKEGFSKITPETLLKRSWAPVSYEEYQKFYPESEYAGWTAAFGIQLNHFTVFFNALKTFPDLKTLNDFLQKNQFDLNAAGGLIKGTPSELLEQSSTNARRVPCEFAGGRKENILGCYYEFAKRYPIPGTKDLFNGFIPKSADKIFESTYEK